MPWRGGPGQRGPGAGVARAEVRCGVQGRRRGAAWRGGAARGGVRAERGDGDDGVVSCRCCVAAENQPIHIHGYDFHILAEGFGYFDPKQDAEKFNLVDPPQRNIVAVLVNSWSIIRFVAEP
ncbi:hypothetical protein GUJ93_ZPchr0011g27826 [Zizania palustris]|uniref:Plastocyanin-like domain-containing protein n=1 Tax=Zizania palustris TaxID=103762 RepID=A0A8J5WEG5_ZIZPA|nr:hypothetical protein GUJ93_ZPchr0011g27826 [Zizania palustris]